MWKCRKCNEEVEDQFEVCWNCGADKKGSAALNFESEKKKEKDATAVVFDNAPNVDKHVKPDNDNLKIKYPALRTLSVIFKVLAVIVGIGAVINGIYFLYQGSAGLLIGLISIIAGFLTVVGLLAFAELIKVFIDIEYNTRQTSKRK